jgi:hypothetical protein
MQIHSSNAVTLAMRDMRRSVIFHVSDVDAYPMS